MPRRVPLGRIPDQATVLPFLPCIASPAGAHDHVVVDVAAPAGAPVDLFVEGPTPDWALPQPEPTGGDGETRQFTFDLDGLPPDAHAIGATLTFTAVSQDDAIEVPAHLD